jgi:molecular chaperone DnaJ
MLSSAKEASFMIRSTHYAALGLDDHERAEAIRGAYRDLARRYHPARVGPGGVENFRLVAAAYRVLSDSSLRRFYDDARSRADRVSAPPPRRPMSGDGDGNVLGPSVPIETLSLNRAAILDSPNGGEMLARLARNFSGVGVPKSESAECLRVRFLVAARDYGGDILLHLGLPVLTLCESCAGHGATAVVQCRRCDGGGFVESERTIALTLTAASADASGARSLASLGIHNFYLRAIVQIDPALN